MVTRSVLGFVLVTLVLSVGMVPAPVAAAESSTTLVWRSLVNHVSKFEKAPSKPITNCTGNVCTSRQPLNPGAILKSGAEFLTDVIPACRSGRIKIDVGWVGVVDDLRIALWIDERWRHYRVPYDPEAINATWEIPFEFKPEANTRTVLKLMNEGNEDITVHTFGHTFGCPVTTQLTGVWQAHNVYENELRGSYINVNFTITGQQGYRTMVKAYFHDKDEQYPIRTGVAQERLLSTWKYVTPNHHSARYSNVRLFIPYNAIPRSSLSDISIVIFLYDDTSNKSLFRSSSIPFFEGYYP